MNNASHLLAQHGELLQVGPVITGQPLGDKSPRFLSAVCVAALCIAFAAGAGHITQGVREEAARVAAAEKAEAARLAEEKRIAAAQVAGLQKRLTAMQTQISTSVMPFSSVSSGCWRTKTKTPSWPKWCAATQRRTGRSRALIQPPSTHLLIWIARAGFLRARARSSMSTTR
ncbi:hypothetical protein EFK68_04735 [Pseudomonas aeruginosa]|nr:hypothetical protein EFK68_04735 [Pseudomonas aeruginosa]